MDVQKLMGVCVSPSEVNTNVEKWVLEHFSNGSVFKTAIECPVSKSNVEYHRRHYINEQLYDILNDITVAKVSICLTELNNLDIYNKENIIIFIDFVFDTVAANPSCAVAYARLCREIVNQQQVPSDFKKVLCSKCQTVFEKKTLEHTERRLKAYEIRRCSDPFKMTQLKLELDEYEYRLREKYTCFIQFMGELFLLQLLSNTVVIRFVHTLLKRANDESLECVCLLLSMVGQTLEESDSKLDQIIYIMHAIVDDNHGNISCKVWRMAHDLFALRNSRWAAVKNDSA